jgi:hypothetical protein
MNTRFKLTHNLLKIKDKIVDSSMFFYLVF